MTRKIYIVSMTGERTKAISAAKLADLLITYGVAGHTYNDHGQVIYLHSRKRGRIHSVLVSSEYGWEE